MPYPNMAQFRFGRSTVRTRTHIPDLAANAQGVRRSRVVPCSGREDSRPSDSVPTRPGVRCHDKRGGITTGTQSC